MTTTTTAAELDRHLRPNRPWLWLTIVAGSVLLHAVIGFGLLPWLTTTIGLADADPEQLAQAVEEREAERQERERERRQQLRLEEEQAEELQEQIEARERARVQEDAAHLEQVQAELEDLRDQAFEELQQRQRRDVVERDLPELMQALDEIARQMRDVQTSDDNREGQENQALAETLERVREHAEAVQDRPEQSQQPAAQLAEALQELDQQLGEASFQAASRRENDRRIEIDQTRAPTRRARAAAEALAEKVQDIDALNSTRTAQSTQDASEAERPDPSSPADTPSPTPPPTSSPTPTADNLAADYERARQAETAARRAFADLRAAEVAMRQNTSFTEAQSQVGQARSPQREDLSQALSQRTPQTVGELNAFRRAAQQAGQQSSDMAVRTDALLAQATGQPLSITASSLGAAASGSGAGTTGGDRFNTGGGYNQGLDKGEDFELDSVGGSATDAVRLPDHQIIRQALPGRMFTRVSDRRGWLYLDTWYTIGPWFNDGETNFDTSHPPEAEIDLDARYTDGRFADQPGHPDQVLSWHFVQSDEVRVQPHRTYGKATYYAYTEVYFDEPREMILAFGADAAGRIWVNDELIWEDDIRSVWRLIEGYRRVRFRQGYNRILVRLMNGSGETALSVLICPPEFAGSLGGRR